MSDTTTTTRAEGAPALPELRETLALALQTYPELRRELCQALAGVDRALGVQRVTGQQQHNKRRVDGLRS